MRLRHLVARGFRNLADLDCEPPASGLVLLGGNAQGKTNLLEAIYYPVLFRSVRGAPDREVARFDGPGFQVEAGLDGARVTTLGATYSAADRRKRILVDGQEPDRVADAVGEWLAVSFLPGDVGLTSGSAGERRGFLDRLLSLADRHYLRSLSRYRAALAQRNRALRQGRVELARAFDEPLAVAGAAVVQAREHWAAGARNRAGAAAGRCLRGLRSGAPATAGSAAPGPLRAPDVSDGAEAGRTPARPRAAGLAPGWRKGHHVNERRPPATLADALASYLRQSGFSKRLQQAGIVEQWAELVGPQIAAVTAPESVTPDGMLRVRVATAAWANELSLMPPRILARLNAGRTGRVKEIRWVPGPLDRPRP